MTVFYSKGIKVIKKKKNKLYIVCLLGYLIGGHVMRLCHGHDESLTIPGADRSEEEQRSEVN